MHRLQGKGFSLALLLFPLFFLLEERKMTAPLKTVVLASHFPGHQIIRWIFDQCPDKFEIIGVFTDDPFNPLSQASKRQIWNFARDPDFMDRYGQMVPDLCKELSLSCWRYSIVNGPLFEDLRSKSQPDVGIMALFGQILPNEFIELFSQGIVNFHPCGLNWPSYGGPTPQREMLLAGERYLRIAAHWVTNQVDEGIPLHFSNPVALPPGLTERELTWITQASLIYVVPTVLEILWNEHVKCSATQSEYCCDTSG